MKNKKLTYMLIVIVAVVWGMIIYRIVGGSASEDDDLQTIAAPIKKESYNDYAIPKDTTHLLLNYRDPFGLVKPKDTLKLGKHLTSNSFKANDRPAIDWAFIRYSGYIRNSGSKKLIAILKINGRSVMMSEGETEDKVKLIKNMRDSIKISFDGKIKFITRHTGTI